MASFAVHAHAVASTSQGELPRSRFSAWSWAAMPRRDIFVVTVSGFCVGRRVSHSKADRLTRRAGRQSRHCNASQRRVANAQVCPVAQQGVNAAVVRVTCFRVHTATVRVICFRVHAETVSSRSGNNRVASDVIPPPVGQHTEAQRSTQPLAQFDAQSAIQEFQLEKGGFLRMLFHRQLEKE